MHSLMANQSDLYRLSKIVLPKPWKEEEDLHLAILSYITTPLNHMIGTMYPNHHSVLIVILYFPGLLPKIIWALW